MFVTFFRHPFLKLFLLPPTHLTYHIVTWHLLELSKWSYTIKRLSNRHQQNWQVYISDKI